MGSNVKLEKRENILAYFASKHEAGRPEELERKKFY